VLVKQLLQSLQDWPLIKNFDFSKKIQRNEDQGKKTNLEQTKSNTY
jgi:hypothetical protein